MIYLLLFAISGIYASLLSTRPGRVFAEKRTTETVVLGVGLVLAALRFLLPWPMFRLVLLAFGVAGLPMIARSLMKRFGR